MSAARRLRLGALTMVVAIALGACSSAPALSDPTEILTKAIEALQNAKTVHLAVTVDGQFMLDLTGQGGGSMDFTGTTLAGDLDITNTRAKVTFAVPALLGLTGEVIAVDGASYVKTSLTGALYQKSEGTDALPVDPTDPDATIAEIKSFLKKPEVSPTKGDDVDCDGKKCYSITIELTDAELAALESASPDTSADPNSSANPDTTINLTILVEKDSVRLHRVTAVVTSGTTGNVTAVLAFTDWDKAVTIEAPPDDQVTEGTGLPL